MIQDILETLQNNHQIVSMLWWTKSGIGPKLFGVVVYFGFRFSLGLGLVLVLRVRVRVRVSFLCLFRVRGLGFGVGFGLGPVPNLICCGSGTNHSTHHQGRERCASGSDCGSFLLKSVKKPIEHETAKKLQIPLCISRGKRVARYP